MKEVSTNSVQETSTDLGPETKLLLSCLTPHQEVVPADFERVELTSFLNTLECHRLTSLFYTAAKSKNIFPLPAKNLLEEHFAKKKFRMLTLVAELCRVVKQLEQSSIPVVALKGPLLGQHYYGDYTLRECNDLDILVKPADVQAAYGILKKMGYLMTEVLWSSPKQKAVYHTVFHHYNMYNPSNNVMMELHWRLYSSNRVDKGATQSLWSNLTTQKLGGLDIQALSRYDTFIYLCVHGSAHQWKRLFWVQDIVKIIEKEGGEFVEKAYQQAAARGVSLHVLEGCYLSHILFEVNLPLAIQQAVQEDHRVKQLAAISMFSMKQVTAPDTNPVANLKNFILAQKRVLYHYRTTYYLGGEKALISIFKRFFINPKYWRLYSFDDRFFFLNYVAAPFLWVYSVVTKNKE